MDRLTNSYQTRGAFISTGPMTISIMTFTVMTIRLVNLMVSLSIMDSQINVRASVALLVATMDIIIQSVAFCWVSLCRVSICKMLWRLSGFPWPMM